MNPREALEKSKAQERWKTLNRRKREDVTCEATEVLLQVMDSTTELSTNQDPLVTFRAETYSIIQRRIPAVEGY